MTTAQQIAAQFNNDGQCWTNCANESLGDVADRHAHDKTGHGSAIKYIFTDGSILIDDGDAWDFGIEGADCFCWKSAGHHGCKNDPEAIIHG